MCCDAMWCAVAFFVRCYGALCCAVQPCALLSSAAVICDAIPCYATLCYVTPSRDICYAGASSEMMPKCMQFPCLGNYLMLCYISVCHATLCVAFQFNAAELRHDIESNVIPRVVVMHRGLHCDIGKVCHQKYMFLWIGLS